MEEFIKKLVRTILTNFFRKSSISFFSKALLNDSIGLKCLIFANLDDGLCPTKLSIF